MNSVDPKTVTVVRLKEKLTELGLNTAGAKAELIVRLMEADPTGECLRQCADKTPDAERMITSDSGVSRDSEDRGSGEGHTRREMEQLQKEKDLAERELALARREIELLQQLQQLNMQSIRPSNTETINRPAPPSNINVTAIADLLSYFDGSGNAFANWEKQIRLLRTMYRLQEDASKILIGSRLKGKALDWFHSRPEYIDMPVEQFLTEMRTMFYHRPNKIAMRKQFENRVWTKGENFSGYLHDKVILGNQVPIDEDEIVDYIIDGIPDPVLRDQARIQRFDTKASLLEAFEKITLRCKTIITTDVKFSGEKLQKSEDSARNNVPRTNSLNRRCHGCGSKNHLAANCPTKDRGSKCFECRGFGHIAANCPKKQTVSSDSCTVSHPSNSKFCKEILMNGHKVTAMIDTGSDLCLMRADKYRQLGSPRLQRKEIRFRGVGCKNNRTLGEFCAEVVIDENTYTIIVRVVSDSLMQHELLIGTDFLNTVEMTFRKGKISIAKLADVKQKDNDNTVPEILHINCHEVNTVDISYIANLQHRSAVKNMIEAYNPINNRDIVVKDKERQERREREERERKERREREERERKEREERERKERQLRLEREKQEKVRLRKDREKQERREREERDRLDRERREEEKERLDRERKRKRKEKERLDRERCKEKEERQRFEKERREKEKRDRLDKEKHERDKRREREDQERREKEKTTEREKRRDRENRRNYKKERVSAREYDVDELVAIKRTQPGPELKFASKYLGIRL